MTECMVCFKNTKKHFFCNHFMCKHCTILYLLHYKNYKCPMCREDIYIDQEMVNELVKYAKKQNKLSEQEELFFKNFFDKIKNIN